MKLLFTSFGINVPSHELAHAMLVRMPPVAMRNVVGPWFMPDFGALLLCDRLVLDERSYGMLVEHSYPPYRQVAQTFSTLRKEGFVELVDFDSILDRHSQLLENMIEADMRGYERWFQPLSDSLGIWRTFVEPLFRSSPGAGYDQSVRNIPLGYRGARATISPPGFVERVRGTLAEASATRPSRLTRIFLFIDDLASRRQEKAGTSRLLKTIARLALRSPGQNDELRDLVHAYLSYVNANLVLSADLDIGFRDWADLAPLYKQKFLPTGRDRPEERQLDQAERLFTVSFPELAIIDDYGLLKILNDKRIADLRQLVERAVDGDISFDHEFAKSVLRDVFHAEKRAARYRSVASYLTIPLTLLSLLEPVGGFLAPTAASQLAGLGINVLAKRKHRWFYMLEEVASQPRSRLLSLGPESP